LGPEDLEKVLRLLPLGEAGQEILVGLDTPDDAAVFMLDGNTALVHTLDFFTPIVDDPFRFGQIAAANAMSDIYAMGGTPLSVLNIVCFPCSLDMEILASILRGGLSKVREAGAVLLGGHSLDDDEPKYGLAVTGKVDPRRILTVSGAQPGDLLVLTKPLGTGTLSTALKGDFISEAEMKEAMDGMAELNAEASRAAIKAGARACTDVTGFGLAGHLLNMLPHSGLACEVYASRLPVYPGAREMAAIGMKPAGAYKNREFVKDRVFIEEGTDEIDIDILHDPQTSGGLLLALPPQGLETFSEQLGEKRAWAHIGEFAESSTPLVRFLPRAP
jgi:selenide,water dikinase